MHVALFPQVHPVLRTQNALPVCQHGVLRKQKTCNFVDAKEIGNSFVKKKTKKQKQNKAKQNRTKQKKKQKKGEMGVVI